jgi:argininosuccinate lyase
MKKTSKKSGKAMWGGRFDAAAAADMQEFSKSVHYDKRLHKHDIRGSRAHAAMLRSIGILTKGEWQAIDKGLEAIGARIEKGKFTWRDDLEDVHMNIESALTAAVPAGAKLHTGRSRNDQVATDMRLWLKDQIIADLRAIEDLQRALLGLADDTLDVPAPSYTHLQRAQPVSLAHYFMAYVEMLGRDHERLGDAFKRVDVMPLGSGALAGSTLPLDRNFTAKELGFSAISANSLDAVSDRDFIAEYLFVQSLAAIHLSRLSEDLILWSTAEFGFIRIGDAFTTGSSLMPQKKNPDAAELIRGKSGRVIGNLMSILTLLKGLPMAYNRDLQEDKERLFDTADTVNASLRIMAAMLRDTVIRKDAMARAVADPALLATDVADALVLRGVPFRHAHEIVGKAVAASEKSGVPLDKLSLAVWKAIDPRVDKKVVSVFSVAKGLAARRMPGSPNPKLVAAEIRTWWKRLG